MKPTQRKKFTKKLLTQLSICLEDIKTLQEQDAIKYNYNMAYSSVRKALHDIEREYNKLITNYFNGKEEEEEKVKKEEVKE